MSQYIIKVLCSKQTLTVYLNDAKLKTYPVSTGLNGVGEQLDSGKTPRGWHEIADKIGAELPTNAVMIARQFTGEIYSEALKKRHPDRDWILTRILRLRGLEPGKNLGGDVDTYNRYIYLHGTPDDTVLGQIGSKGCVRMANLDIIALFSLVPAGTKVLIEE